MHNIPHFIAWMVRKLFGNIKPALMSAHRWYIDEWKEGYGMGILATSIINVIVFMVLVAFHGLGIEPFASILLCLWIAFVFTYLISVFFYSLWCRYRAEQDELIRKLKS